MRYPAHLPAMPRGEAAADGKYRCILHKLLSCTTFTCAFAWSCLADHECKPFKTKHINTRSLLWQVALCASRSSFVLRRTKKRYLAHAHCLGEEKKERSYHSAYKETGDTKLHEIDRVEKRNWKSKCNISSLSRIAVSSFQSRRESKWKYKSSNLNWDFFWSCFSLPNERLLVLLSFLSSLRHFVLLSLFISIPFLSFPALKMTREIIKLETFTMTHLNACARAMVLVKVTVLRCAISSVLRPLLGLSWRKIKESFSLFLVGHSGKWLPPKEAPWDTGLHC